MTTETLKDLLREEANRVFSRYTSPNWDGYDAEPATQQQYHDLLQLIEWLPEGIKKPEVIALPTGELALEWFEDRRKNVILLLEGRKLDYAALVGDDKTHGKEELEAEPSASKEILLQYFRSSQ